MSVMSTTSTPQLESIEGIVERITFHSDESGYTVARFKVPRTPDLVTIIGNFAQIEAGQTLKLSGIWRDHPNALLSLWGEDNELKRSKPEPAYDRATSSQADREIRG
jgi:hypothetical protein